GVVHLWGSDVELKCDIADDSRHRNTSTCWPFGFGFVPPIYLIVVLCHFLLFSFFFSLFIVVQMDRKLGT
uniref:Uncharacterized protein n=1 Tax=Oryza brachyantha TaxID=4533 RepID=J3LCG1_ORYBR